MTARECQSTQNTRYCNITDTKNFGCLYVLTQVCKRAAEALVAPAIAWKSLNHRGRLQRSSNEGRTWLRRHFDPAETHSHSQSPSLHGRRFAALSFLHQIVREAREKKNESVPISPTINRSGNMASEDDDVIAQILAWGACFGWGHACAGGGGLSRVKPSPGQQMVQTCTGTAACHVTLLS